MGIGIDNEAHPHLPRQAGHVTVGEAMAPPACDLEQNPPLPGEFHLLRGNEAGMGQEVDLGHQSRSVGPRADGFGDGLPVDRHNPGPQFSGPFDQARNGGWRNVGDLDAWNGLKGKMGGYFLADLDEPGDDEVDIGSVHVVSDGEGLNPLGFGPAKEFRRDENPITQKAMGMKVDQRTSLF